MVAIHFFLICEHDTHTHTYMGFPGSTSGKEPTCKCRRCKSHRFDPWVGKIPWRRKCNPLQYSCLESPVDRRAWWATVHRVAKESDTPEWLSMHGLDLADMGRLLLDSVAKCQHNFAACPADLPQLGPLMPAKFRQTSWQDKRYVSQHLSWKIFDSFPHIIPNGYVVKCRLYFSALLLYCCILLTGCKKPL